LMLLSCTKPSLKWHEIGGANGQQPAEAV